MRASLLVALFSLIVPAAQQPLSPDAEGFIRNWLVLAPIAIEGESGAPKSTATSSRARRRSSRRPATR